MWFATDFTWKLVNLDTATAVGDAVQLEHITSRRYAAPEIRRAVEQRSKQTRLECSSDMWAVGLVAFEIFTGRYRTSTSNERECEVQAPRFAILSECRDTSTACSASGPSKGSAFAAERRRAARRSRRPSTESASSGSWRRC